MNMRSALIGLAGVALLMTACSSEAVNSRSNARANAVANNANTPRIEKPAVDKPALEAELRSTDLAWSEAAGKKDLGAVVGFMADDGSTLPPNEPLQKGKEAITKGWSGLLGLKDLTISWTPLIVEVAESGETGTTSGSWGMTWTDAKGGTLSDKGKYVEIWKRVDGKWKCYLDIYNSDQVAPANQ